MLDRKKLAGLILALAAAPAIAQENLEYESTFTPECVDLQGAYAVADLARTPEFLKLLAEFTSSDMAVDKPVLSLQMPSQHVMTRTDVISQESAAVSQVEAEDMPSKELFAGARIGCVLEDREGSDEVQIVHVDLSGMSKADLRQLADYFGSFWSAKVSPKALRSVSDFIVMNASMIGGAAMFFAIPLKKI